MAASSAPRVPGPGDRDPGSLAEGASRWEILRSYLTLAPIHIDAAIAYAAERAREESRLPLRPA